MLNEINEYPDKNRYDSDKKMYITDSEGKEKTLNMKNNANLQTKSPLRYVTMIIIEAAYHAAGKNKEMKFCPNCGKERKPWDFLGS